MTTAIYGGSFDPPHLGHVMVVSHLLLNDPSVDHVMIVPCYQQQGKKLQPFNLRYAMCTAAFGFLPRTSVSTIEATLGGESVTLRTIMELRRQNPNESFRFVMGSDLLTTCYTWEGWDQLSKLAPPLVIGRAGIAPVAEGDPTPISPIVSSTLVRAGLEAGDYNAVRRYLPVKVLRLIEKEKLYFIPRKSN